MKNVPLGIGVTFRDSDGRERHLEINNDPLDGFKIRLRRGGAPAETICLTLSEALAVQGALFEVLGRPTPCNPDAELREKIDVKDWLAAKLSDPRASSGPGEAL